MKNYSDESVFQDLIAMIGDDVTREGLRETPGRAVKAWKEWSAGYNQKPEDVFKTFKDGAEHYNQFVIVKDIPVYSHCEHHLAAFFGTAAIGYLPNEKIVGLSKFPRLVNIFAKRLQVQERLTQQIAMSIQELLQPKAVGVILECRHLCMESRGIRTPGTTTITSAMYGAILNEPETRAEFLNLVRG